MAGTRPPTRPTPWCVNAHLSEHPDSEPRHSGLPELPEKPGLCEKLREVSSGCPPKSAATIHHKIFNQSPAKEHRNTLRTKTQDGTLLDFRNRHRPSGRPSISTCPGDTLLYLPCDPVVSIRGPGGHQRRLAVSVEFP